jgi:hypothetical protein
MPQYSGDLYNPSNASEVAVNAQKAQPSSLFGTRKLKFFTFSIYYCLYTDSNNFYDNLISVTGGTADGRQVTYNFDFQATPPFAEGDVILVGGMTHGQYNGEFTVVASTNTSVTVDWYASGDHVTGGSIALAAYRKPDSFYSYLVRAIQQVAEVYYLGAPTYKDAVFFNNDFGNFVFAISDDTAVTDRDSAEDNYNGYIYPKGYGADELTPDANPTDLTSALYKAIEAVAGNAYGHNGDGWSIAVLDDLGWGFAPGKLAGTPGYSIANPQVYE